MDFIDEQKLHDVVVAPAIEQASQDAQKLEQQVAQDAVSLEQLAAQTITTAISQVQAVIAKEMAVGRDALDALMTQQMAALFAEVHAVMDRLSGTSLVIPPRR